MNDTGGSKSALKRTCRPFQWVGDSIVFLGTLLYVIVVTPFLILFEVLKTIVSLIANYLPLLLFMVAAFAFTVAFVSSEKEIIQKVEQAWRCTIVPLFLAPLPTALQDLVVPYEAGVCYYNALGFTNRILSSKSITQLLANDPNKLSTWQPIIYLLRGVFDALARIGRWLLSFYNGRLPVYPILDNTVTPIIEIFLRIINALCRDLHSPFFYVGRVITNQRLYCAVDNLVNSAVARYQYWITFVWNLVKTVLSLFSGGFIVDFGSFIDQFRTQISDISPVLNVPSERFAMASIHSSEALNEAIHSLICTIVTEVELYTNDVTLVNGTIPQSHTSYPLASNETYLNETVYHQCMKDVSKPYYYNLFGVFGQIGAVIARYMFVIERIFPANLFRIAWEFLTMPGPISDDGTAGYDINTPMPNNSTRFFFSVVSIDSIWDTIRRPLDTLRQQSTIERWPYAPLYGKNAYLYDPMENTTTLCGNPTYGAPPPQENLYCQECRYNRTEANVVSQIEILARNLDDLLEPYIERRLFRPLLFEILGGVIRVGVAIIKWIVDNPRHIASGFDEALIFYARQNYYDVLFDEVGGKPHELGGILNGTVNFFAAIYPSLHVIPKIWILPGKALIELIRNVIRIWPMLLNSLIGIGGEPTYGPRINEFLCLDGSPTCMNIEEQFIKWFRTPRNETQVQLILNIMRRTMPETGIKVFNLGLTTIDHVRINDVFNYIANNYTDLLYGDVYDPNANVPAYRFGWLECFRYLFSPAFVNSFITNPSDQITTAQFPDITCGIYYAGRAVVELVKAVAELLIAIMQTIFDLFSNTNPYMPAVLFRWLACTEPGLCIPILEALSDAQDFVECPCHFLGDTFLKVPCVCNLTSSVGLGAVNVLRAGTNVELAFSQLIVCITAFPNGTTNITSKGCYGIVFDRVIDIFTKLDNATTDLSDFGAGIGCLIGNLDPLPCGSAPPNKYLYMFSGDIGYYAVQFLLSLIRSVLDIVESFFVYIRNLVIGVPVGSNPATGFTFRFMIETVLNNTIGSLVGDPTITGSYGLIQSLGRSFSCLFGNGSCDITDDTDNDCPGWFLVKIGNVIRSVYICLIKMIGNLVGGIENLFTGQSLDDNIAGFFEGFICFIQEAITGIIKLIMGIIGGFLDAIFGTGDTITNFLNDVADAIDNIINILKGIFFDIGEALDCSLCWTECLGVDAFPSNGKCKSCYCECKCQRPTLPNLPCRWDWDNNSQINDNEVYTPVNPTLGVDCPEAEAGNALAINSSICWHSCIVDNTDYNQLTQASLSAAYVVSPTTCPTCYCQCKVQPSVGWLYGILIDATACNRDWDNDTIIEANEMFTPTGIMPPSSSSYQCSAAGNNTQFLECISCWWHYLNSTLIVNEQNLSFVDLFGFTTINLTIRLDVTASPQQCLDGWCTCQCQYPIILNTLVQYNVDVFDQLLPILSTINLNDPYNGQFNFTNTIITTAKSNFTLDPIVTLMFGTLYNVTGQRWLYTNFHGYCQKDWDGNGYNVSYKLPAVSPVELPGLITPYGKCAIEIQHEICQYCWGSYYFNVVAIQPFFTPVSTTDQQCLDGWCLCGCNPGSDINAIASGFLGVTSNCTRDWDGDSTVELFAPPTYLEESTLGSNCSANATRACADCWFSTIIAANTNFSLFDNATCSSGWCACQCQIPPLVLSIFNGTFYSSGLVSDCYQDWDGNGTATAVEPFAPGPPCLKKRSLTTTTAAQLTPEQQQQFLDRLLQGSLANRLGLNSLWNLPVPPTIRSSLSAGVYTGASTGSVAAWFSNTTSAYDYSFNNPKPSMALGEAQNMYMSLKTFAQWNSQALKKRTTDTVSGASPNLCSAYLVELFDIHNSDPSKFESMDRLLAGKSYSDKALFQTCYSLMIGPSLLNDRLSGMGSLLSLPKYLFMDNQEFKYWIHSGLGAAQTYINWRMQQANMEVSPTLLQGLVQIQKNQSNIVYNQNLVPYLKRFGAVMKRQVTNDLGPVSAHIPSFADALILGGVTPNPNLRVFAEQLDQYVAEGRTNERTARRLQYTIQVAQQSTLFDGIVATIRGMRQAIPTLDPVAWGKMIQRAVNTTVQSKTSLKMITSSFATGHGDNHTIVPYGVNSNYGPYGNRNNPNFKVFSGVTLHDKIVNAAAFYGRVWNHFKVTQMNAANTRIKTAMTGFTNRLAKADGLLRAVETYQFISQHLGESLKLPTMDPALIQWIQQIRQKQNIPTVNGLSLGEVRHLDLISNATCNVTRCFECALLINTINEVYDNFKYCTDRALGYDVIKRFNYTTITDSDASIPEYVSPGFLGIGDFINRVATFVISTNADPFNKTGEPLGLFYYVTTYAPIPYIGYCDRDIHTTCQSGIGFKWALLVIILITVGLFICWLVIPSLAGMMTSLIGILGYVLFVVALLTSLAWGMNALCLQTPGLSILSIFLPIQLPIIPECVARDISEAANDIIHACFDFLKAITVNAPDPFTCPSCPGELNIIDCNSKGYKTIWDVYAFGLNWLLWQVGVQNSAGNLLGMNSMLDLTDSDHTKCFWMLFVASSPFLLTFGLLIALYLISLVMNIISILLLQFTRITTAKLFTRS